jgi:NodT family efflux transporter outer membrane factor (OMF) lipoprotein
MKRLLAAAAAMLAATACTTVGPDHRSPLPTAPAQGQFAGLASPAFSGDEPPGRWWSLLGDPVLDSLVRDALTANTDLRVAAANLRQARAVLRETRAGRLPTTEISASATLTRPSAATTGGFPGSGDVQDVYDVGLDVGYQVDLFGRVTRAIEASRADVDAVQAAFDLTRVSVAAETTRAYLEVCSTTRRIAVARETVRLQEEILDLTRRQLEGGRGTALETSQAASLLEQTRASIPNLEAQRQVAAYRLSVLTGRPPASIPREIAQCTRAPSLSRPIPVGNGATLLARRPDIRQAERRLASATARIGVATADLYPNISIGASVGSTANSPGGLVSGSGFRFGIGPLVSFSFPNTSVARARVRQAEAAAEAELGRFDGTWLAALQETESALTRYARELDRLAALERARAQSAEAARIARLRFDAGRESFQVVLDAQRSIAETDAAVAQSQATLADILVSLFLALGGGWQEPA